MTDNLAEGTIGYWVKPNSDDNAGWIIHSHYDNNANGNWHSEMGTVHGGIRFGFISGSNLYILRAHMTIPAANWTFVTFTWDENGSALYINGNSRDTDVSPAQGLNFDVSQWSDTTIGCNWKSRSEENLPGKLDEVAIWDRALTAEEIQQHYWLVKPGPAYTLTITATAGGTTSPSPGSYKYTPGEVVVVTATPDNTGYIFDHWELNGDNVGATNPISVTMDNGHTLHAVFIYGGPGVPEYPAADISIVAATLGFLAALCLTLKRKKQPQLPTAVTSPSKT